MGTGQKGKIFLFLKLQLTLGLSVAWVKSCRHCFSIIELQCPGLEVHRESSDILGKSSFQLLPFTISMCFWIFHFSRICCRSPTLKTRKSSGYWFCFSRTVIYARSDLKSWLRGFLSSCLHNLKIPKVSRGALVAAIPKPLKPVVEDQKSYWPISLLCVLYKIFERLIQAHMEPIIDLLLPHELAGFRRRKFSDDQVTLLTQSIEDTFEAKMKCDAVLVDLTALSMARWSHVQAAETCELAHST